MSAIITTKDSKSVNIFMGCYGIGVTRIVAAAIEQLHDEDGIIWPKSIAPFNSVIIEIDGNKNSSVRNHAQSVYELLNEKNIDTIFDDRDLNLGKKIKDWELIGVPDIIIIGKKESENKIVTYKQRASRTKTEIGIEDLYKQLK